MRAPSFSLLFSALLGGAVVGCNGKQAKCLDASLVVLSGTPVGKEVQHDNLTLYITKPDKNNGRAKAREGTVVLYLSDIFGLPHLENKLLADSYARAGYLTVAPDLFEGAPFSGDPNAPNLNTSAFLALHTPAVTDPIVATAIAYIRSELGATRIAAPGYCFGGRYTFRALAADGGVDVGYAAHPSLLGRSEIAAIAGPVSVAAGERDVLFGPAARAEAEAELAVGSQAYQVNLYGGTQHGFAVRADLNNEEQRWAKEQAFLQAVGWFDRFLSRRRGDSGVFGG